MTKVSVIIPNLNGEKYLGETLQSLQKQTFADFETIITDNGSTDGSARLIKAQFPEIQLVELGRNRGFAGGVNAGIKRSRGQFIALLNNDAVPEPEWLAELVKAMAVADIA